MLASIVVPTYNRLPQLKLLIASLNKQTLKNFELIVIDDHSSQRIEDEVHTDDYDFSIKLRRNNRNIGPGASRNIGVQIAKCDLILFTDDDCILHEYWVEAMTSSLNNSSKEIAGIGGCTKALSPNLISKYYDFHRILDPKQHDIEFPERIPYLVTANCAMRKDVIMKAGGFDSRIPQAGGEDTALSIRIIKLGYYFQREPNAVVYHDFRASIKDFYNTFYRYGLGGRYIVNNYLPL